MKLLRNSGNERVIDRLRDWLRPGASIDLMSPEFSLHAFAEMQDMMAKPGRIRLLLGEENLLSNLSSAARRTFPIEENSKGVGLPTRPTTGSRATPKFAMQPHLPRNP